MCYHHYAMLCYANARAEKKDLKTSKNGKINIT